MFSINPGQENESSLNDILIITRNNLAGCLNEALESLVVSGMMESILQDEIEELLSELRSMCTDIQLSESPNDHEINRIKALLLHGAIILGQENRVKYLLQNGAHWNMRDNNQDYTALHLAALLGHVNIFNLLMEQFDLEADTFDLNKVLSQKVQSGLNSPVSDHNESMEGIPVIRINAAIIQENSTLLHLACKANNPDKSFIIQSLLDYKISVEALDQDKKTALHLLLASNECQFEDFQTLLQASIAAEMNAINHQDIDGNTPLMAAVMRKEGPQLAVIRSLLEEGADFKIANKWDDTPQDIIVGKIKIIKADLDYLHGERTKELEPSKQEVDNKSRDLDLQIQSHEQQLDTLKSIVDLFKFMQLKDMSKGKENYLWHRYIDKCTSSKHRESRLDRLARYQDENHSASSASSSAIRSSTQSRYNYFSEKRNNCKSKINFANLRAARAIEWEEEGFPNSGWNTYLVPPIQEKLRKLEFPSLKKLSKLMHLEDCIDALNEITEIGIMPPRAYMNAILKKFQAPGRSTIDTVWELYNIICEQFSNIPDDHIVKISTHSEMMLNLIRRNNDIFRRERRDRYQDYTQELGEENGVLSQKADCLLRELETIFNNNPDTYTYNVLLQGYYEAQQYSDYKSLFLKRQDLHDDWTFSLYIEHCNLMDGKYVAQQAFSEIFELCPEKIGKNSAVTLLNLFKGGEYQELKKVYDSLPEKLQRKNGTRKKLIINLMRNQEDFHKARSIYDDIRDKGESIYEAMMKGYSKHADHLKDALDIYGHAVEAEHFTTHKPKEGRIDLHHHTLRGAVSGYEGMPFYLMKLCLLHYKKELEQIAANRNGELEIICGKGKFFAKAYAKKILTEKFGWDVSDHTTNAGCLNCYIEPGLYSDNSDCAESTCCGLTELTALKLHL